MQGCINGEVFTFAPTAHEEARSKTRQTKREQTKCLKALERSFATKVSLWSHWTMTTRCHEVKKILDEYERLGEPPPSNILLAYTAIIAGRGDVEPPVVPAKKIQRKKQNGT